MSDGRRIARQNAYEERLLQRLQHDLRLLGLGRRRGHDLRRTMIPPPQDDGASRGLPRRHPRSLQA